MRKKVFAFLGLFLVFAFAEVLTLLQDFRASLPRRKFDQIEIGMTRQQLLRIIKETPHGLRAEHGCLDTWDFEDGACIWLIFEPDCYVGPDNLDKHDPEDENWKVSW